MPIGVILGGLVLNLVLIYYCPLHPTPKCTRIRHRFVGVSTPLDQCPIATQQMDVDNSEADSDSDYT